MMPALLPAGQVGSIEDSDSEGEEVYRRYLQAASHQEDDDNEPPGLVSTDDESDDDEPPGLVSTDDESEEDDEEDEEPLSSM